MFAVIRKEARQWQDLILRENGLVVVLDGLQDPGNVGTIIRSADAVGAAGVVLGRGCADLYNPKTLRSTMGSLFHLPVLEGGRLCGIISIGDLVKNRLEELELERNVLRDYVAART